MNTLPAGDRLTSIRAEAWSRIPFRAMYQARFTWKRQGHTPMWITVKAETQPRKQPGYDIIGGMAFYTVDSVLAQEAPSYVLETVYGAMFAHTAKYCFAPSKTIHENGNGDVSTLPSWKKSLETARRWGFPIEHMINWLEKNTD